MPFIVTSQLLPRGRLVRSWLRSAARLLAAVGRSPRWAAATASATTVELSTALSAGECTRSFSMGSSSGSRPWYQRMVTSCAPGHHSASMSPAAAPLAAQIADQRLRLVETASPDGQHHVDGADHEPDRGVISLAKLVAQLA